LATESGSDLLSAELADIEVPRFDVPTYRSFRESALAMHRNRDSGAYVEFSHNKEFPYYVEMNITLSIDDGLVKEVRKIAVERDTTLTGLVRGYLKDLVAEHERTGRKRREREALERSFRQFRFHIGRKTWAREQLHERS
jgi:hypothetical protein